ncbi:Tetratricopeptide repeat protein [Roseovarius gaetbuli]|uniref:Tetratricopeptide repeat protein n=1 Tax=Roseovarius gaetbuli TaxID=1356575 RepID=A0A1X6ZCZ2_9RHOB|nr:tetratricopeptide repeat protein [Roseovarius gaetbuli]SLN48111.1 Tetratricopeptide repeat protein [Roseovarius gaetbuli]
MTPRAGVFLAVFLALAGCVEPKPPEGPYAPGFVPGAEAVGGLLVGHRLMDAGEFELAQKAYTRAAVTQGMTADILAGLGSANLGLGRLVTAERLLRKAVEKDQSSPEIWNNLGVVLVEQREYLEAEQVFRRAYALDNGESDSIRDNLRLALAKSENSYYDETQEQDYKLVRRGSGDYLVRKIP